MSVTGSTPTEDAIMTALRTFLLSVVPAGTEVVQGQPNRVAEPGADNFVVMTPLSRKRLSTNADSYPDGATREVTASVQMGVQLDVHGELSSDIMNLITLLWRDPFAIDATVGVFTPLYADEPHQAPFINGENQYENRWVMALHFQADPVAIVSQDSATAAVVGLIEVDSVYPP